MTEKFCAQENPATGATQSRSGFSEQDAASASTVKHALQQLAELAVAWQPFPSASPSLEALSAHDHRRRRHHRDSESVVLRSPH